MIDPSEQNPLARFKTYQVKHVIMGFRFSEDACTFDIKGNVGVAGTLVGETPNDPAVSGTKCKGPGIVFVNELEDPTFVLYSAHTRWDFFSAKSPTTGTYAGTLYIQDRVGMLFADKLRSYQKILGMAVGHITFAWKTFYVGETENGQREVVTSNPMIFHVTSFAQSLSAQIGNMYVMNIVSSYNTFGQLPQFSKMFQTTLTHSDGNTQKDSPIPDDTGSGSGIVSRQEEDRLKREARKIRLDKSKPMKNLGDIFNSFQAEMTEQGYANTTQIQEWQASVRQDYTKKLTPPEQYLPELPLKYTFKLEDKFNQYKVDNRNLPFEQPEQDQRLEGIRSIPFHYGTVLSNAINDVMMLSRSVSSDISSETPNGYRSTVTVLRDCSGQYNINTNVNSYIIPINREGGPDTGPGDGAIDGPLTYVYRDTEQKGRDIRSISFRSDVTPLQKPLEQPTDGADDIGVVYGNREQQSIQRAPTSGTDFFTDGYTGNRSTIAPFSIAGLENASSASVLKSHLTPSMVKQTTAYTLEIVGNPYIVNDINRNPIDVVNNVGHGDGSALWSYILYDKVEHKPMYMHLTVYMRADKPVSGTGSGEVDQTYYYKGHLHISTIETKYTNKSGFTHTITALRTGDGV